MPVPPIKYAGFWIRFVAFMLDGLILIIPVAIIKIIAGVIFVASGFAGSAQIISSIIYIAISWSYFASMTYYKGATLGKMIVGLQVKSESGERLSSGRVVLRETIGKIISGIIIYIGFIMAGFTTKKQALHDKIAKTVVVYKDPTKPHTAGLIIGIVLACILPVIAIIGILSSVVLVSLNVARQKGQDAQIEAALNNMRLETEMYYNQNNNSYSVARDCSSGVFASPSVVSAKSSLNSTAVLTCYAEGSSYAISASLNTARSKLLCGWHGVYRQWHRGRYREECIM